MGTTLVVITMVTVFLPIIETYGGSRSSLVRTGTVAIKYVISYFHTLPRSASPLCSICRKKSNIYMGFNIAVYNHSPWLHFTALQNVGTLIFSIMDTKSCSNCMLNKLCWADTLLSLTQNCPPLLLDLTAETVFSIINSNDSLSLAFLTGVCTPYSWVTIPRLLENSPKYTSYLKQAHSSGIILCLTLTQNNRSCSSKFLIDWNYKM